MRVIALQNTLRWLTAAAVVQITLLFALSIFLSNRVRVIQASIRDLLFQGGIPVEVVDRINQHFAPVLSELMWVFWGAIFFTVIGYTLLRRIVVKAWSMPDQ